MPKVVRCCRRPATKQIIYDSGDKDQELILCDYHFNLDPAFQRNIKKLTELKS